MKKQCPMCQRTFNEDNFTKDKDICVDCQIRIKMAQALNKAFEQAIDEINEEYDDED
jgi:uncharacterized protein (DUF983 family)